jgi:hypothetical protein
MVFFSHEFFIIKFFYGYKNLNLMCQITQKEKKKINFHKNIKEYNFKGLTN